MSVKAVNDSVDPDGLVPTLLVFGSFPRLGLPSDPPTPSTFKRAVALRKATTEISKHFASRKVRDPLKTRNGPDVTDIHKTPISAPVLVYRPEKDKWEGPYSLLEINGENIIVLVAKGPTKFRSTVVKPYLTSRTDDDNETVNQNPPGRTIHLLSFRKTEHTDDKITTGQTNKNSFQKFDVSRNTEFNGLIKRRVFSLVPESEANGFRIYGSRFVDRIKNEGNPSAYKILRFVVQAYNDSQHGLLTHAPTVQRVSQRLLLSLCAMDEDLIFSPEMFHRHMYNLTRQPNDQYFSDPPRC